MNSLNFDFFAEEEADPDEAEYDRGTGRTMTCLESCLRELSFDKRQLPAKPGGLDNGGDVIQKLDLVTLAAWMRHTPAAELATEPFKAILLRGVARLGLMVPGTLDPTLADLRLHFTRLIEDTLASHVMAPASITNPRDMRDELDGMSHALNLPEAVELKSIFASTDMFAKIKLALLATSDTADIHQQRGARLDALCEAALTLIERKLPPATFKERLCALIKKSGLTDRQVAQDAATNVQLIRRLKAGVEPRLEMEQFVHRLELVLGAEAESLWSLVTAARLRTATDDVYTREVRRILKVANCHMDFLPPNWFKLSDAHKQKVIDWIQDEIILATPYRRMTQEGYERLEPLTAQMQKEFAPVVLFKTDDVPNERSFPRVKKASFQGQFVEYGGQWTAGSARTATSYLTKTLTVTKTLAANGPVNWNNAGCGFLINSDVATSVSRTIAHKRYLLLKKAGAFKKLNFAEPANELVYADSDVSRLETIMGLFCPHTGYFYHKPPEFTSIPGLVSQNWIERATDDWHTTVNEERDKIRSLIIDIAEQVKKIRDPWLPIEPLLALDEPLTPVVQAIDQMALDRPSFYGSPMAMGRHDRSFLIMNLLVHSRLRRVNYSLLTWRPDNTGNLRWDGAGYWMLVIPQADLKNEGSSAYNGGDLEMVLDPRDEELYLAIDHWVGMTDRVTGLVDEVGSSRHLLHGLKCGDKLFPGRGSDGALSDYTLSSIVYRFSAQYLTHRPWCNNVGIRGVIPFGPHAIRDIVATHVLKNTKSIEEAAAALFDVPETLKRHYARFTNKEKSIKTNDTIRNTTQRKSKQPIS